MSGENRTPEVQTTSEIVQRALDDVASEEYRNGMDYFTGPADDPEPPTTAVEVAQRRAVAIQAGKVIQLS